MGSGGVLVGAEVVVADVDGVIVEDGRQVVEVHIGAVFSLVDDGVVMEKFGWSHGISVLFVSSVSSARARPLPGTRIVLRTRNQTN